MTGYSVMKDFTFGSRDEFTREPIAEKIIKLLDSAIDVSPMIIDGKWGTGKTEFCFKLKNLIEADNTNDYKIGYVNAFQADHANEPLLTLIAAVAGLYEPKDRVKFIKKAIPYLRLVTGIGLKSGLSLILGKYGSELSDEYSEGMEDIKEGSKSFIDQSLESMIKEQIEAEKNLHTLQTTLLEITEKNPVILLIDELDRCRPDFAVAMLETIKHVFDIENVQIVLVTNVEQLKATIKHSYGSETDSHSYLYKFFKYQINLPTTSKGAENRTVDNNVTYFRKVVQESKVIPQSFKDNELIYEIPTFLDVGTLSLRNIEQIVRCIETLVVFENIERSKSLTIEQILMVFLSFVYMMDKDLLNQIVTRHINPTRFSNFIKGTRLDMRQPYYRSDILNDLSVKNLFLIAFDKYFVNSFLDLPSSTIDQQAVKAHIQISLAKYNYVSDMHNDEYIKQIINNLLLFDIVK